MIKDKHLHVWLYLLGPYLLGIAAGNHVFNWYLFCWSIVFLILLVFINSCSARLITLYTKNFQRNLLSIVFLLPGLVAYFFTGATTLNWRLIGAGILWSLATHAYLAVPFASSDQKVFLEQKRKLAFSTVAYLASSLLGGATLGVVAYIIGLVYLIIMRLSFQQKSKNDFLKIYRWFTWVNLTSMIILILVILFTSS